MRAADSACARATHLQLITYNLLLMPPLHRLLIDCPDAPGLIHKVTGILFDAGLNLISNREYVDPDQKYFFMRTEFPGEIEAGSLREQVQRVLPKAANVRLHDDSPAKIVILATKEYHCLGDLLIRSAEGSLGATIEAVVSNHAKLETLVRGFGLPFHAVPHADMEREAHEAAVASVIRQYDFDYLVLAKYMRILSNEFVQSFEGKMINIHHSFLPAFIGAKPYHQAHARGVKIVGATAHFVTSNLDEGPIIAQGTVPVDHSYTAEAMAAAGRDVKKIVLARALNLVLQDRVFVHGNKTVIL